MPVFRWCDRDFNFGGDGARVHKREEPHWINQSYRSGFRLAFHVWQRPAVMGR